MWSLYSFFHFVISVSTLLIICYDLWLLFSSNNWLKFDANPFLIFSCAPVLEDWNHYYYICWVMYSFVRFLDDLFIFWVISISFPIFHGLSPCFLSIRSCLMRFHIFIIVLFPLMRIISVSAFIVHLFFLFTLCLPTIWHHPHFYLSMRPWSMQGSIFLFVKCYFLLCSFSLFLIYYRPSFFLVLFHHTLLTVWDKSLHLISYHALIFRAIWSLHFPSHLVISFTIVLFCSILNLHWMMLQFSSFLDLFILISLLELYS